MGLLMACALAWPELVHRRAHVAHALAGMDHIHSVRPEHAVHPGASTFVRHTSPAGQHPHLDLTTARAPRLVSLALPTPIHQPTSVIVTAPAPPRHPPLHRVEPWRGPPPGPPLPGRSPPLA
jgi:hypothetical protein